MYLRCILSVTRRVQVGPYMTSLAADFRSGTLLDAVSSCLGRNSTATCSGAAHRCLHTPARRWQLPSCFARHAAPRQGGAECPAAAQQHGPHGSRRCRRHVAAQAIAVPAVEVQSSLEYADGRVVKVCCHCEYSRSTRVFRLAIMLHGKTAILVIMPKLHQYAAGTDTANTQLLDHCAHRSWEVDHRRSAAD